MEKTRRAITILPALLLCYSKKVLLLIRHGLNFSKPAEIEPAASAIKYVGLYSGPATNLKKSAYALVSSDEVKAIAVQWKWLSASEKPHN
jgi:hypothetical protein